MSEDTENKIDEPSKDLYSLLLQDQEELRELTIQLTTLSSEVRTLKKLDNNNDNAQVLEEKKEAMKNVKQLTQELQESIEITKTSIRLLQPLVPPTTTTAIPSATTKISDSNSTSYTAATPSTYDNQIPASTSTTDSIPESFTSDTAPMTTTSTPDAAPMTTTTTPDAAPMTTSRTGKLPTDLPKFIPGVTEIHTFFKLTEAKLRSHNTPFNDWYRALGKQTSDDTTLLWVNDNILVQKPHWELAKQLFYQEFSTLGNNVRESRDRLIHLKQGKLSCAEFFRKLEILAAQAQQDIDDPFFLDHLRRVRLNSSIMKQLALRSGSNVHAMNFLQLKRESIYIESILDQFSSTSTSTSKPCHSCGSHEHRRSECPYRDAICSKCGKQGHISDVCKSSKTPENPSATQKDAKTIPKKDITCYKCGEDGHYASNCPNDTHSSKTAPKVLAVRTVPEGSAIRTPNPSGLPPITEDELAELYDQRFRME